MHFLSATLATLFLSILSGCHQSSSQQTTDSTTTQQPHIVGADRDAHGCIGSAGYTWSTVRNECIRTFEAGIRLSPMAGQDSTFSAFLVLAPDSLKAELFVPDSSGTVILNRQGHSLTWQAGQLEAQYAQHSWAVAAKGQLLYKQ